MGEARVLTEFRTNPIFQLAFRAASIAATSIFLIVSSALDALVG
jgi:hypothetical protein